jgi:hypothetical protein
MQKVKKDNTTDKAVEPMASETGNCDWDALLEDIHANRHSNNLRIYTKQCQLSDADEGLSSDNLLTK